MDIHEKIAVMQAFAEGKKIECAPSHSNKWSIVTQPNWNWVTMKYRVKALNGPQIDWDHVHPDFNYLTQEKNTGIFLSVGKPQLDPLSNEWVYKEGAVVSAKGFSSLVKAEDRTILTTRPGFE